MTRSGPTTSTCSPNEFSNDSNRSYEIKTRSQPKLMMKTQITLLALAGASLAAFAADITGTWKAEFDTQRGLQKYTFTLKQDGTKVTGKTSVEREGEKREADLKDGKVEGDTVTFVEPLKIQDNEVNITY